jgi:hypothetical protein
MPYRWLPADFRERYHSVWVDVVRDKYREGHDLIIKARTTREPFPFNGKYTKLRYVNT